MIKASYCLITGASGGLGSVLARCFWDAGYHLVLTGRNELALNRLTAALTPRKDQVAFCIAADFSKPESTAAFIRQAQIAVPKIDVLINNAAVQGPIGPVWENDWNAWQNALQVDLLAPIDLCRLCLPWMGANGGGSILNISGGGATGPRAHFSAYATAKAGLARFTEVMAQEAKKLGVRAHCIAPGAMKTAMLAEVIDQGVKVVGEKEYAQAQKVLLEGGSSMERVAELCLFLASDAASGISGKLISAVWDPWETFLTHLDDLNDSDIYTLRRIVPKDRGMTWGKDA